MFICIRRGEIFLQPSRFLVQWSRSGGGYRHARTGGEIVDEIVDEIVEETTDYRPVCSQ